MKNIIRYYIPFLTLLIAPYLGSTTNGTGDMSCESPFNCLPDEVCKGSCFAHGDSRFFCAGQCIPNSAASCLDMYDQCSHWLHLCSNSVVTAVCRKSCNLCGSPDQSCPGFRCDGRCVPLTYLCDGVRDCRDNADEIACNYNKDLWFTPRRSRRCGIRPINRKPIVAVEYSRTKRSLGLRMKARSKRLINGRHAQPYSWPWTGFLENVLEKTFCGATLIHPEWAITVAHCLPPSSWRSTENFTHPDLIFLTFGKHAYSTLFDSEKRTNQIRNASEIHFLKQYQQDSIYDDIALIKLSSPVILNDYVNVACMPLLQDLYQFREVGGVASGWGHDDTGKTPRSLKQMLVKHMDRDRCSREIFEHPSFDIAPTAVKNSILCAEHAFASGFGALCSGDSGGPMMGKRRTGSYALLGISVFSTHSNCSHPSAASVYNNVYYYLPWIRHYVDVTFV